MTPDTATPPPPTPTKLLYTPVEAAALLSLGRSTIYILMARNQIRSVRIGGSRRIPATALHDYLATLTQTDGTAGA